MNPLKTDGSESIAARKSDGIGRNRCCWHGHTSGDAIFSRIFFFLTFIHRQRNIYRILWWNTAKNKISTMTERKRCSSVVCKGSGSDVASFTLIGIGETCWLLIVKLKLTVNKRSNGIVKLKAKDDLFQLTTKGKSSFIDKLFST